MSEQENKTLFYLAGEEASAADGAKVDDAKFTFVQQDKKIHDVKFTTKPTTFMADAMNRFRKNKSSVVGGIILGVLFLLALILPTDIIPYDISNRHNYETNLPMKLNPAGSGFWDGTRKYKNQTYPFQRDADGNTLYGSDGKPLLIDGSDFTDPDVIVNISDFKTSYLTTAVEDGQGGYAQVTCKGDGKENGDICYLYFQPMAFDLKNNNYQITYSLGTTIDSALTEYSVLLAVPQGTSSNFYTLNATKNYGTIVAEPKPEEKMAGAQVTSRSDITFSVNDLITAYYEDSSHRPWESITESSSEADKNVAAMAEKDYKTVTSGTGQFSLGLYKSCGINDEDSLFVSKFEITGTKKDGSALGNVARANLRNRSFGGENSYVLSNGQVADANSMVLQEQNGSSQINTHYWKSRSKKRFEAIDVQASRCTLTVDAYLNTYGLRKDFEISQKTLENWKKAGYVTYDLSGKTGTEENPYAYHILSLKTADSSKDDFVTENEELAKKADETVYVKSLSSAVDQGNNIYAIKGTVLMYRYLGYSSIPIHIFGTEYQGKDMLKYVFSGLRTSLLLGIIVAAINIFIGVIWGSVSGYFGGSVDIIMERFTDILGGIPWIVLMTVLTLKMGQTFFVFALALCLTGWIGTASTTRSQFYRYRDREYVLAAKTLGAKSPRLIFRHILPNAIGTIITRSILMIPSVVFDEATISYLGLGFSNLDSLGVILSKNQAYLSNYPSQLIIPAIIISLLMICFNLFGNGLRDAFNPSLKGTD